MSPPRTGVYYALAVVCMALVFSMYTQPDFMVTLANQVWACF